MIDIALHELMGLPSKEIEFDEDQAKAINACCDTDKRIVAVTGPAGTGKTRIIKEVYERLSQAGYLVVCSAPTGKAAKRIQEATGIPAVTNHRLLGYGMPIENEVEDPDGTKKTVKLSTGPKYHARNPLAYDVILADEYAMVNTEIHNNLIAALKPGARIRCFGDVNQLKPIEEDKRLLEVPTRFEHLLTKFEAIELRTIHRQAEGSGIAENGKRILEGRFPQVKPDFVIRQTKEPVKDLITHVKDMREKGVDYASLDHQIITCMNKSWIGTKKLNAALSSLFWKREYEPLDLPRHRWDESEQLRVQIGSKVVITSNMYDLNNGHSVFNGEVGIIVEVDHTFGAMDVDFGDRVVTIPPLVVVETNDGSREFDPRKSVELAYVLTTHKMQGSEAKHVTYVLGRSTAYMQSRRNFYTAITRAREHITLITDMFSINKSLQTKD